MQRIFSLVVGCLIVLSGSSQSVDSLATGLPVIFKSDTLFLAYIRIESYKPADQVNTINRRIAYFMKDGEFEPDRVYLLDSDMSIDIWWRDCSSVNIPSDYLPKDYKALAFRVEGVDHKEKNSD